MQPAEREVLFSAPLFLPEKAADPIHLAARSFRDLEKLSRKDRVMVIALIDAVIASRQHEEVTSRRARRSA